MNGFEDQMNKMFGSNKANYTVEDIEEAKKRQKKYGGTLYDNLSEITAARTGKKPLEPIMGNMSQPVATSGITGALAGNLEAASLDIERIESAVKSNADDINATLSELNKNLKSDFSFGQPAASGKTSSATEANTGIVEEEGALERFAGVSDILKEKVFGQDEFIKKLIIAFKRPFVSERDDNDALNSIFVSGPACTGRHYTLDLITDALFDKKVLTS
ncbi:MAG: hypothetical protein K6E63_00690, partial [Lachnospiraceae bacterium]|nr:hypothetical protein [Lachnospiraceae bacterium]